MSNLKFTIKKSSLPKLEFDAKHGWVSYALATLMTVGVLAIGSRLIPDSVSAQTNSDQVQAQEGVIPERVKDVDSLVKPTEKVLLPAGAEPLATSQAPVTGPSLASQNVEAPLASQETTEPAPSPAYGPEVAPSVSVDNVGTPEYPILETTNAPEAAEAAEESAEPNLDEVQLASTVVSEFYQHLGTGDLESAYDRLAPDFREVLSFRRFCEGYQATEAVSCEIKHSELLSDDRVRLDVAISVTEDGVPAEYLATCLVSKADDGWLLSGVVQLKG